MSNLILASGSPRRKELISLLGIPFLIRIPDICEDALAGEKPDELVLRLSKLKAQAVSSQVQDSIVVAADTVVSIDNKILGKPADKEQAFNMIKMLQGRTHQVFTGTCISNSKKEISFVTATQVTFDSLDDITIRTYVDSGECTDKAGGYAIQGIGAMLISKIQGSVSNVIGLPVCELRNALMEFGITPQTVKK
ncbi:MAG: Maf family protein [Succinivibrio sp.]